MFTRQSPVLWRRATSGIRRSGNEVAAAASCIAGRRYVSTKSPHTTVLEETLGYGGVSHTGSGDSDLASSILDRISSTSTNTPDVHTRVRIGKKLMESSSTSSRAGLMKTPMDGMDGFPGIGVVPGAFVESELTRTGGLSLDEDEPKKASPYMLSSATMAPAPSKVKKRVRVERKSQVEEDDVKVLGSAAMPVQEDELLVGKAAEAQAKALEALGGSWLGTYKGCEVRKSHMLLEEGSLASSFKVIPKEDLFVMPETFLKYSSPSASAGPDELQASREKLLNKVLPLPREELVRVLGDGLNPGMEVGLKTMGAGFLLRSTVLDIIQHLNGVGNGSLVVNGPRPHDGIVVDGKPGGGKSMAHALACWWARSSGWLVVNIPEASRWMKGGGEFYEDPQHPGIFQSRAHSHSMLNGMLAGDTTAGVLDKISLKAVTLDSGVPLPDFQKVADDASTLRVRSLPLVRRPVPHLPISLLPAGAPRRALTLGDLVRYGAIRPEESPSIVALVREQLNWCTEVPVLIAMEEYNAGFDLVPAFRTPENAVIYGAQTSLFGLFGDFSHCLPRGTMLATVSDSGVGRPKPKVSQWYKTCRTAFCGPYRDAELRSTLSYQRHTGFITKPIDPLAYRRLVHLTGGDPSDVNNVIKTF